MKNRLLAAILILVISVTVAHAETEEADTRPMFGLKFGLDVNVPGDWRNANGTIKMFRQGYGFTLGAVYNIFLDRGFYLEPGISFYYDQYSFDNLNVTNSNGEVVDSDPKVYKLGVRIPLVAGYAFNITDNFSMSAFTGPEISYSFAGKYIIKHKDLWHNMDADPFGEQRRFDCAWRIGVGFPVGNFLASLEIAIGMTDLMKNPDISFRENRISGGFTYYF